MAADDSPDALSTAIVEAVADDLGVEPQDVAQPLGEVVDSDALDRLFRPHLDPEDPTDGSVSFSYSGYDIRAYSDGRVDLSERVEHVTGESVASEPID